MPHQNLQMYVERVRAWPAHVEGRRFAPGLESAPGPAQVRESLGETKTAPPVVTEGSLVRCPRCGTWRRPDHLMDVTDLAEAVRGARTHPFHGTVKPDLVLDEADDREWACDGCQSLWVHTGAVSRADLFAAMGAPASLVAELRTTSDQHVY